MWFGDLTLRLRNWLAPVAANGPFGNHATLTDGLVSYWALDETSGTRYDSVVASGNDLTDNNTVGYVNSGPSGVVAGQFISANSEYLDRANASLVSWPTGDFHFAVWIKSTDNGEAEQNIASKLISTGDQREWRIYHATASGGRVVLAASSDGTAEDVSVNTGANSTPFGQWNFVEVRRSGTTIGVAVDGGAFTDGTLTGVFNGTAAFNLGARNSGTFGYYNGIQARAGIWSAVLSAGVRASLYNSGKGKSYADLTTAEKIGLVSYWNLDEASGNRADSHGSNTLTDNNTVGSATNSYPANLPGRVANFVAANSEYLSYPSGLTPANNYSVSGWFQFSASNPDFTTLLDGGDTGADPGQWALYDVAPGLQFLSRGSGSPQSGAVTYDSWVFVYFEITSGNVASIAVNGGALTTSGVVGSPLASTKFRIGSNTPAGGSYYTGKSSSVAIWSRVLTSQERTDLFNSGAGLFYGD